jgi:hypothetical protein
MSERPIIFNGEMVRAIKEKRKTMTRRVLRPQPESAAELSSRLDHCPYGKVGDRLWVKEAWGAWPHMGGGIREESLLYKADGERVPFDKNWRWRSPILMRRRLSRFTLEITSVSIERLNEISFDDCIREGIRWSPGQRSAPILDFMILWNEICGDKYPWVSNPYVWVISFRLL